jgi:hypothetical protein
MKNPTNYVIGVGPIGLMTAKTLAELNENVVMIAPKQGQIESFSVRNFNRTIKVKSKAGTFGGTARIWDYQCTRLSRKAFGNLSISELIKYEEYIDSSRIAEEILGIRDWPTISDSSSMEKIYDELSITEEFSVIAPKHSWDIYFKDLFNNEHITILEDRIQRIKIGSHRELELTQGECLILNDNDRIFLACGTIGNYKILKDSQLVPPTKLQYPFDHPSLYAARISGVNNNEFRVIFKEVPPKTRIKKKYLVSGSAELGIFELREKWPTQIRSLLQRALNLLMRQIGVKKYFLPDLYLWIQLAQARNPILTAQTSDNYSSNEWSASTDDVNNFNSIMELAEDYLKSFGMSIERTVSCKSILDLNSKTQEAYHPSGIIEREELSELQEMGINVLGASVLGNLSWNNPTLPAMAISRCLTLRAVSNTRR